MNGLMILESYVLGLGLLSKHVGKVCKLLQTAGGKVLALFGIFWHLYLLCPFGFAYGSICLYN